MEIMALMFLLAFAPGSDLVAAPDNFGNVVLWSVSTGAKIEQLNAQAGRVTSLSVRHDGKYLVTGTEDGVVALWDFQTRTISGTRPAHTDMVIATAFSGDGKILVTGARDGTISIWTVPEMIRTDFLMTDSGHLYSLAFSEDGEWIAATAGDGALYTWHGRGTWRRVQKNEDTHALSVVISHAGDLMATGGSEGGVKAWRVSEGRWAVVRNWETNTERVSSIAFCPQGHCLAFIEDYEKAYGMLVHDSPATQLFHSADGENGAAIWDIAFSANGNFLAMIDGQGFVRIVGL